MGALWFSFLRYTLPHTLPLKPLCLRFSAPAKASPRCHWDFKTELTSLGCEGKAQWGPRASPRSLSNHPIHPVSDSATRWTVAHWAAPSMGLSRQEYWSGLPFPSAGDLPDPGIEPGSPTLQADTLTSEPPGKPPGSPWEAPLGNQPTSTLSASPLWEERLTRASASDYCSLFPQQGWLQGGQLTQAGPAGAAISDYGASF